MSPQKDQSMIVSNKVLGVQCKNILSLDDVFFVSRADFIKSCLFVRQILT